MTVSQCFRLFVAASQCEGQSCGVNTMISRKILFQFREGFRELAARTPVVFITEVIEPNGRLYQPLIKKPLTSACIHPEFFPRIMSFEEESVVEFFNTSVKELFHLSKNKKKRQELQYREGIFGKIRPDRSS